MPAGVTWPQYLRFSVAAMASMVAGSQLVHLYYRPLRDLNEYINRELKTLPPDVQETIKKELIIENILKSQPDS